MPGGNRIWTNSAGGSFVTAGNWQGGVIASDVGNTANFSTLKLQQPYLSDISAVTVDSGAMLHLDFTGNDVIAYLKLGVANL